MSYSYKTDLMRVLLQRVSHDYRYWTAGQVPPAKAQALILKFANRYKILASSQQRYRKKLRGEANSHLAMWRIRKGS